MSQIIIKSCVHMHKDGTSHTALRKAILDTEGHLVDKFFLTNYGEWVRVKERECIPPECLIETSIHDPLPDNCL